MKIKNYLISIIGSLFLVITFFIGVYRFYEWRVQVGEANEAIKVDCQNGVYKDALNQEGARAMCENVQNFDKNYMSFFYMKMMIDDFIPLSSNYVIIVFVVLGSGYFICKFFKNNLLTFYLQREKYTHIIGKLFFKSLVPAFIVTGFILFKYVVFYLYCGNLDSVGAGLEPATLGHLPLFLGAELFVAFCNVLLFTNVVLIVSRKQHHFLLESLLSFLIIMGIEVFLEVFINALLVTNIAHLDFGLLFNILSFGYLNDTFGIVAPVCIAMSITLVSFVILMIVYKDREKLLIDCEANK